MSNEDFSKWLNSIPKKPAEIGMVVGVNTHKYPEDPTKGVSGTLVRIEEVEGKKIGVVEIPGKGEFRVPHEFLMDLNG